MEVAEPPNYGPQEARFGPRCSSCKYYEEAKGLCAQYSVPVDHFMCCDSWKRNPNLPITVV